MSPLNVYCGENVSRPGVTLAVTRGKVERRENYKGVFMWKTHACFTSSSSSSPLLLLMSYQSSRCRASIAIKCLLTLLFPTFPLVTASVTPGHLGSTAPIELRSTLHQC